MADPSKLHIAMFPWLAFGHMIPYLEFAKLIAQKGHKISFISTPRNIDRLPKIPPNLSLLINFVKLPLPQVSGLPQDAEATSDVPYEKVQYLKKAYDGLKESLTIFLQTSNPDWLLYDFAPYWLPDVSRDLGIANAFFSIFLTAVLSFVKPHSWNEYRSKAEDFTVPPKWVSFPSKVAFQLYEILRIFDSVTGDESDVSDAYRFQEVIRGCDTVIVRSCKEFEPEWLHLFEENHGKPCIPVGMLATTEYNSEDEENETWRSIREWLDKQEKGSVVYVAFGSEAKPTQAELNEIALGLELSGFSFFWVLKKRRGLADTEVLELPDGFEERTKGRGVVCTSWVPQMKIIAHQSIGAFFTHSGWSSVVEAMQHERALILLPLLADQGYNARLLEEKKIGYPIPRHKIDGSFTRDSVAESLRLVMVEEDGLIYRNNAKQMNGLFCDWVKQDAYVDNCLEYLQSHKLRKNNLIK